MERLLQQYLPDQPLNLEEANADQAFVRMQMQQMEYYSQLQRQNQQRSREEQRMRVLNVPMPIRQLINSSPGIDDDMQDEQEQASPVIQREYQKHCFSDDQFVDVSEHHLDMFRCPINRGIIIDPVQDSHGHLFCKPCIKNWFKIKSTCPSTNLPIEKKLYTISQPIQRMLNAFNIKCINANCDWVGEVSVLQQHLDKSCQQEKIPCRHGKCKVNLTRKEENIHQQQCLFRKVNCEFCQEFKNDCFYLYQTHLIECEEMKVACPNCSQEFKRREQKQHTDICEYQTCMDCSAHIKKGSLKQHIQENLSSHLVMIGQKFKKVKKIEEKLNDKKLFQNRNDSLQRRISAKAGVDLQFGDHCDSCKCKLCPSDPQYYCPTCLITQCETCGDKIDEGKVGTASLSHSHSLIYIHVKNNKGMKNLKSSVFGYNLFYKTKREHERHRMKCNSCSSGSRDVRWVCISCPTSYAQNQEGHQWIDLCGNCMKEIRRHSSSHTAKRIKDSMVATSPKHDFDSHVYLRINFSSEQYNQF